MLRGPRGGRLGARARDTEAQLLPGPACARGPERFGIWDEEAAEARRLRGGRGGGPAVGAVGGPPEQAKV